MNNLLAFASGEKDRRFPRKVCGRVLSQTSDKCHLSGGFDTWAGVKGGGGREKGFTPY